MTDRTTEERLTKECAEWFHEVEKLLSGKPEPEEEWAELWFDGYSPAEAVEAMKDG
jgi:hypothetical protein